MYLEPADGSSSAELLPVRGSEGIVNRLGASPDGRFILYNAPPEFALTVFDRSSRRSTELAPGMRVFSASVHPAGRHLAFTGTDSQQGVWILSIDELASAGVGSGFDAIPIRLTSGDDSEVRWSPDGTELFFRSTSHVMSIAVEIENGELQPHRPIELFEDRFEHNPMKLHNWAIHPDGRFLFLRAVEEESGGGLVYIQNWVAKVAAMFEDDASRP